MIGKYDIGFLIGLLILITFTFLLIYVIFPLVIHSSSNAVAAPVKIETVV